MGSPLVSVIIAAFNLARYLPTAIDSALSQDDPGGPVEVIVVDDGSADETPQILARYEDRVTVIRQPNRGFVAAVDRGLREVRGQFVALLDADDEWPRDRLRRHVAILERNPTVGLVHGDMELIDAVGNTIHPSFFALKETVPTDGRVLGRLLANNFISGGASTFRASMLPAVCPIAPEAAYPDWWIAAAIATVADVVHDDAVSNRYRLHGANMGLNAAPERLPAIHRRELPWRRWMLLHLVDDDSVSARDIAAAIENWMAAVEFATSDGTLSLRDLLALDDDWRKERGPSEYAAPSAVRALTREFVRDPCDDSIFAALRAALIVEAGLRNPAPPPPLIALEARPCLTIAWLPEVTSMPQLLRAFAEETADENNESLAVLVPRGADLSELVAIVEADDRLSGDRCDITAISEPVTTPARMWLAARACARLTVLASPHPYSELALHAAVERAGLGLATGSVRSD